MVVDCLRLLLRPEAIAIVGVLLPLGVGGAYRVLVDDTCGEPGSHHQNHDGHLQQGTHTGELYGLGNLHHKA